MSNPFLDNDIVIKRKFKLDNDYLIRKINYMQPSVDQTCPESFVFSKTIIKKFKYKSYNNIFKENEKKKQNELIVKRLEAIYLGETRKLNSKNIEENFNFKEKKFLKNRKYHHSNSPMKDTKRKWELFKITQDNQTLLKRLIDSKPSFNGNTKLPNLKLKKYNSSNSINIHKEKFFNKLEKFEDRRKLPSTFDFCNRTDEDFFKFTKNNFMQKKPSEIIFDISDNSNQKEEKKMILYARKAFINKLYIANIKFVLENKKFLLVIEPISFYVNKRFILEFDSEESVKLLKRFYKNYERIINDLEFDGQNVIISNPKAELIYVKLLINKILS